MNVHANVRSRTNMTSKGQVMIPKAVREHVGLVPGQPVHVAINDRGEAVVTPATLPPESEAARRAAIRASILSVAGTLNTGKTTDEMMIELRGDEPFI